MEIMQQQSANHLDGRWRSHLLPYTSGHTLSSIPNLHDHVRQQMISQQQQQQQQSGQQQHQQHPQSPIQQQHSSSHLQQQLQQQQQIPHPMSSQHRLDSHLQQQQRQSQPQPQHSRLLMDPRSETKELLQPILHNSSCNSTSSSSITITRRGGGEGTSLGGRGEGRGRRDDGSLPSPSIQMNNLTLQSSPSSASPSTPPTPSPSTPSPGKSGGKDGEEKKGEEWEQYNAGAAFLGPTLWDKTLSYDSDLKVSLEYMDLDEFLNENGIPLEESKRHNSAPGGGSGGGNSNVGMTNGNSLRVAQNLSPEAPSSPENSSPQMGSGMGACPQRAVASANGMAAAAAAVAAATNGGTVLPPALSPQDYVGDCSSSVSSPGSPDPHSPLQVPEPEGARASQGRDVAVGAAASRGLNEKDMGSIDVARALSTVDGGLKSEVHYGFKISPNDLALATVPGQDFDPRTRCFSEEELKPQPMIKKSRKQFVPAELKDEKYWARRRKNNLAAKRSRDARRLKENQIAMRANFLEKENMALRLEVNKAAKELESLKTRLGKYEEVELKTVIEMKAILPLCKYDDDLNSYKDEICSYDEDMCKYEDGRHTPSL